ncbi:hypothetical protein [Colwellia psychrerythraea]|uniref:Uncharacterized protein n=1 Tax=Colwellia psychrerythraea TaxID=28229 RepID=A0A099KZ79_COLPS|nr:hypothetical protein [Colwellia psychrerythraea]KGJ95102.1 hypothetical protein GAB14E_1884 [Colwellia psychrerythraea]
MRLFLLILSTILLNGCVASSYISSIGAKSIHGDTRIDLAKTDLAYAEKISDPLGVTDGKALPFTNLYISDESFDTASVKFNYDDIIWTEKGSTSGKVDLSINGETLTFSVFQYNNRVELEYDYRDWYSYPAQSLLILSVPADVVITTVALPIIGLGMLIVSLTMEPPLH